MKIKFSTKIFLLSVFNLFLGTSAFSSQTANLDQEVNNSLKALLPSGSKWEVKVPNFIRETAQNSQAIEVTFPAGIHKSHVTAQIWIKHHNQNDLFAVPIQIMSLGEGQVSLAQN
jgi:hypothetical protein